MHRIRETNCTRATDLGELFIMVSNIVSKIPHGAKCFNNLYISSLEHAVEYCHLLCRKGASKNLSPCHCRCDEYGLVLVYVSYDFFYASKDVCPFIALILEPS